MKISMFALGPHLGPKMDARWPQDGPKRAQDGPKAAQDGPARLAKVLAEVAEFFKKHKKNIMKISIFALGPHLGSGRFHFGKYSNSPKC